MNNDTQRKRQLTPITSSMTRGQQRDVAEETGQCSDGQMCGDHTAVGGPYCDDCPNEPRSCFSELDDKLALDAVNRPGHYQSDSGIECIDAIKSAIGEESFVDHCRATAIKYCWRSGKKANHAEDLRKAPWYMERAARVIDNNEGEEK